jgi:hypothetical protein
VASEAVARRIAKDTGAPYLGRGIVGSFHAEAEPQMREYARRYLRASAKAGSGRARTLPIPCPYEVRRIAPRSRPQRVAQRNKSPGSNSDGSEPPGGAKPSPCRVTDSPAPRLCAVCGRAFTPRRKSTARLCSSACKQAAYRKRLRARVTDSCSSESRPPLTFEERLALRAEVSRRRRIALMEEARRQAALDGQLAEEAFA